MDSHGCLAPYSKSTFSSANSLCAMHWAGCGCEASTRNSCHDPILLPKAVSFLDFPLSVRYSARHRGRYRYSHFRVKETKLILQKMKWHAPKPLAKQDLIWSWINPTPNSAHLPLFSRMSFPEAIKFLYQWGSGMLSPPSQERGL